MPYQVKLPPEGDISQFSDRRLSYPLKSGDSGDGADVADPLEGLAVRASSICPPLPKGVRLLRYAPKEPPVVVSLVSVVNDMDKFIRHYLVELDARLHSPVQIRGGASVFEILSKLAEAGLELAIDAPSREQLIK
jgi:hypothetical protein